MLTRSPRILPFALSGKPSSFNSQLLTLPTMRYCIALSLIFLPLSIIPFFFSFFFSMYLLDGSHRCCLAIPTCLYFYYMSNLTCLQFIERKISAFRRHMHTSRFPRYFWIYSIMCHNKTMKKFIQLKRRLTNSFLLLTVLNILLIFCDILQIELRTWMTHVNHFKIK